jgi:hypothetical protein
MQHIQQNFLSDVTGMTTKSDKVCKLFNCIVSGAGGVAQVLVCLLSKCEVLSSNPSAAIKNKNQKDIVSMSIS